MAVAAEAFGAQFFGSGASPSIAVTLPGKMTDVFVANDAVADVQVKSTNQLYVFGKAGGETTVYASNAAGDIVWSANVRVGNNIGSNSVIAAIAPIPGNTPTNVPKSAPSRL